MTTETKSAENPTEDEKAFMSLYGQIEDLQANLFGTTRTANRLLRVLVTLARDETERVGVADALRQVFVEEKENLLAHSRAKLAKFQSLSAPRIIIENAEDEVDKLTRQCERFKKRSSAEFLLLVDRATRMYSSRMNFNLLLELGPTPEFPEFGDTSEERRATFLKQ